MEMCRKASAEIDFVQQVHWYSQAYFILIYVKQQDRQIKSNESRLKKHFMHAITEVVGVFWL